jgi:hypothetical protein
MRSHIIVERFKPSSAQSVYALTNTYTVDGIAFGKLEPEFIGDPKVDPRYTERFAEVMTVAFALGAAGIQGAKIVRNDDKKGPDFKLILENGERVYVEVSSVINESAARYGAMIQQINVDLRQALAKNEELEASAADTFAEIVLPSVPKSSEKPALLKEIERLIQSKTLRSDTTNIAPIERDYVLLNALGAQIIKTSSRGASHIAVREPARAVGPYDLVNLTLQRLNVKRRQASAFSVEPLWLVLYFADYMAMHDTNLAALASSPPEHILPFSRVLIGDQRAMLSYSADTEVNA